MPVGNNTIKYQHTTKYLGIILDDQLNWKSHITEVNTKITKYIGIFGKVRHLVPKECLISLYYAFIYSRINYGIEMYSQTTAKTIRPLQITQNIVLRKLQFKSYTSNVNDLYKGFSVLKLKDVSRFKLCCFVQRYVHDPDKLPSSVKDIFTQHCQIHSHETRNRYDLHAAPMNTKTYGCKKVSYLARSCWNPLPSEIKSIKLVKPFKESLKSHILSEY